jgi:deazaflavin-dependent oxidoreductase (nitroreductase family)
MASRSTKISARVLNLSGRYPRISAPFTKAHAKLFEKTGGGFLGRWMGMPVLVIETVGRKSGQTRKAPIIYMPDGDNFVVVAANGGNHRPPSWWLNLRDAGEGVAVVAGERHRVTLHVAEGAERDALWKRFSVGYPGLEPYDTYTDRELPVIVLKPATG